MAIARWFRSAIGGAKVNRLQSSLAVHNLEDRAVPNATVVDAGFEAATLSIGSFTYKPAGTGWEYADSAGVSSNYSDFTAGNAAAPQGAQVGVIQGTGAIRQTMVFTGGTYAVAFNAAQRGNLPAAQTMQVLVDGITVGAFNNIVGNGYSPQITTSFNVAGGNHTVEFRGTNISGGDNTLFIDLVSVVPQTSGLLDNGFEVPYQYPGYYQYNPIGVAWTYAGSAGVASNGGGFTYNNPSAPQGSQVAFLQNYGSISQTAAFAAGTYAISFDVAQRGSQTIGQTFQVIVDGSVVTAFNAVGGANYRTLTSTTFSLAAGNHTIAIQGTNLYGGDNTVFIDRVTADLQSTGLNDAGFEVPILNSGTFKYNPTGTPWSYTGTAGVAANYSGFTSSNPSAFQGSQVAFLQGTGAVSQQASFRTGTYAINFLAAQRGEQKGNQTFAVYIDSVLVGNFTTVAGAGYRALSTSAVTLAAGNHSVVFVGTNQNGGDNTILLDQVSIEFQATSMSDAGFETPSLAAGTFQYNPVGSAWIFSGTSGLAANGSGFTSSNANAPQGGQAIFLQKESSVSQTMVFAAGTYVVDFAAAQRGNQAGYQTFQVLVDGISVGTFNNLGGAGYTALETSTFTVLNGTHTVAFVGTNLVGGDNTALIDNVAIRQVPAGVGDSGFESLQVRPGSFVYAPTGSDWTFSGTAGVAANGSGFTAGNPYTPQGSQVAFLQRESAFSQTRTFAAGTYYIGFLAAQRGNQPSAQTLQVLVDGNAVGTYTNLSGAGYSLLTTTSFSLSAGAHTITFVGTNLNGGDNTAFIDQVFFNYG